MRLERTRFAQPPSGRWQRLRWTRRQTVAEEHLWRAQYGHRWYEGEVRAPEWLEQASERPEPEQIGTVYRALRKGREDSKDESGAADFYYGEMEMRRHSCPLAERAILWLYWLVSGYGLRASRALAALAFTIALGAVLFDRVGFDRGTQPKAGPVVFAIESSISLLRAPDTQQLTTAGHVTADVLRLAGPLFLGLALLAIRGRVKRYKRSLA